MAVSENNEHAEKTALCNLVIFQTRGLHCKGAWADKVFLPRFLDQASARLVFAFLEVEQAR